MDDPLAFAHGWVAAWNASDLETILSHYVDDVTFTSPRAAALTGQGVVRGKPALRDYWSSAIARSSSRRFTLERTIWDPETSELAVVYISQRDGRRVRAVELFRFGPNGLVVSGEALYGAEVSSATRAASNTACQSLLRGETPTSASRKRTMSDSSTCPVGT